MPRVSVILPNYNYARYLKERVRSILAQTMTDFELLYLDDASKDESNVVMQEFAGDSRVQMYPYTENSGGVYRRRNASVEMASGEWVWFAEADDAAHPRFLETLLQQADKYENAAIIYCRQLTMDSDGRVIGLQGYGSVDVAQRLEKEYFAEGYEEAVRLTSGCFLTTSSSMLIRKAAYEKVGGFDGRLWQAADWHLYMTLLREHGIAFTPELLSCYRSHRASVTKNTKHAVGSVEDAFCVASTYNWVKNDSRCTDEMKETVQKRLKARIFDMYTDPAFHIPEQLAFAAQTIYEAVPDKRLISNLKP